MSGQCIYLSPTKPNRSPQHLGPLVTALGTVHLPLARVYKIRPDAYDSPRLKLKQKERNKKDGYAYLHLEKAIQKGDNRTHVTDIVYHNGKDLGHAMRLLLQKNDSIQGVCNRDRKDREDWRQGVWWSRCRPDVERESDRKKAVSYGMLGGLIMCLSLVAVCFVW